MKNAPPTNGRVVLYSPGANDVLRKELLERETTAANMFGGVGPRLAATVAWVNPDGSVNLTVHDPSGNIHARRKVRFVQPDEVVHVDESHAHWMPYQVGQTERTRLAEVSRDVASIARGHGAHSSADSTMPPTGQANPGDATPVAGKDGWEKVEVDAQNPVTHIEKYIDQYGMPNVFILPSGEVLVRKGIQGSAG